jgi:hypothetical protein
MHKIYGRNTNLIHIVKPAEPGVAVCGPKLAHAVLEDSVADERLCTLCRVVCEEADKMGDSDLTKVDAAGIVSRLKATARGAANKGSSEMAAKQTATADHSATLEQIAANIERAASLAEAENVEGLGELSAETEKLISSLPARGKAPNGETWTSEKKNARAAFKAAATVAEKPEPKVVKAAEVKLSTEDYHSVKGVPELVTKGAKLFADGTRMHVKLGNVATEIARVLLEIRVSMTDKAGVPDIKASSQGAKSASSDIITQAGELFRAGGDENLTREDGEKILKKLQKSVQNAMPTVRAEYLRELDSKPEEAQRFELITKDAGEGKSVSEAVAEYYGVALVSRYELEKSRKSDDADTDGDDEGESDTEGSEPVTLDMQIGAFFAKAETNVERAVKALKKVADDDTDTRKHVKAQIDAMIADLATLKAGL